MKYEKKAFGKFFHHIFLVSYTNIISEYQLIPLKLVGPALVEGSKDFSQNKSAKKGKTP